jgi:hypothetical protein
METTMRKLLTFLIALGATVFAVVSPASAQMTTLGAGATAKPAYVGPLDVKAGATAWWSCARVVSAAKALTSTSLCDLVQGSGGASPGTAVCTLRGSTSGFVDLSAYCPGSLTPAAACAAVTGGVCNVSKAYNQITPGTHDVVNATAASQPVLVFSSLNGLPGLKGTSAAGNNLTESSSITNADPVSFSAVGIRTSNFTTAQYLVGNLSFSIYSFGFSATTNVAQLIGSSTITSGATATNNTYIAMQAVTGNGTAAINIQGTDTTGTTGVTNGVDTLRIMRSLGGGSLDGTFMEGGIWNGTGFSSTDRTNMYQNQHGPSGYNGGV